MSADSQRENKRSRFMPRRACADSPVLLDYQARDFVEAIREGRDPKTTVDQALRALRLALALSNRRAYCAEDEAMPTERP